MKRENEVDCQLAVESSLCVEISGRRVTEGNQRVGHLLSLAFLGRKVGLEAVYSGRWRSR